MRARVRATVMSRPTIFWDFDETLARRPGRWGAALLEALDAHVPGHGVTRDDIRPHLRTGFPWHTPDEPHPETTDPDAWWERLNAVLSDAFVRVGHGASAGALCAAARARYVDARSYGLFDDTLPVLERLRDAGWRHVVLSNHVPELPDIVAGVGLGGLVEHVVTSARTGYEKPHAEAYAIARRVAGDPERCWMIGDNPEADVRGAESAGIPAILVRNDAPGIPRRSPDLHGVLRWLDAPPGSSP